MTNHFFEQNAVLRAFGADLGRIWVHLGSQKGAQEAPQTGSKTIKKECKIQHEIWERPGVIGQGLGLVVWVAQAPQEGAPGSPGSAPGAPQEAPRGLKSQQDFENEHRLID